MIRVTCTQSVLFFTFTFAILTSTPTFTAFVSESIVLNHIFIDLCVEFVDDHLHLSPLKIYLCGLLLCLMFNIL